MSAQPDRQAWETVLAAGVAAQRAVPGCVAVGGTAAALYAHHRFSNDTDHLLQDLRSRFQAVRDLLEQVPGWTEARVNAPVLILGSFRGVEVGFRQSRRLGAIQTRVMATPAGDLVVPTLDELIGMKAYMAYTRAATRDFLDLAALARVAGDEATVASLMKSDARYGHLQRDSVAMEISKTLCEPQPFDIEEIDFGEYKGLVQPWRDWSVVVDTCRRIGRELSTRLITGA